MHDRRIDGTTYTFGNEGALFMNAMTWYDWQTGSIWSQPWGAAIEGELKGTRLTLVPFDLVPFKTWLEKHPDTGVLIDERADLRYVGEVPRDSFMIGVSIGDAATGFYFGSVARQGVVNESVGKFPVAVFADGETREINVFLRTPASGFKEVPDLPEMLSFEVTADGKVVDMETGSAWDIENGVATGGPLRGAVLQRAPFISSFDWAWKDFFPDTDIWGSRDDTPELEAMDFFNEGLAEAGLGP